MGNFLKEFWEFFATLFSAFKKGAKATENLATVTEEMTATYLDQTRTDRKLQQIAQAKKLEKLK